MFPTQLVQKSLGTNDLINPWCTSLLLMQQRFVTRNDSLSWKKSQSAWWWRCKIRLFKIPKCKKSHQKVVLVGTYTLWIFKQNFLRHKKDHILKVGELKSQKQAKTKKIHLQNKGSWNMTPTNPKQCTKFKRKASKLHLHCLIPLKMGSI